MIIEPCQDFTLGHLRYHAGTQFGSSKGNSSYIYYRNCKIALNETYYYTKYRICLFDARKF